MTSFNHIFLVGPLPPPVHGMALVTDAVRKRLAALGARTTTLNIAADSLNRAIFARLARVRKIIFGLTKFSFGIIREKESVLYLAVSGGWGQVYDLLFLFLARLRGTRMYLHHHNISYITEHKRLTQLLIWIAGPKATHVVASERLGCLLKELYPPISETYNLSAVIVTDPALESAQCERSAVKTIGFIGNISEVKGIFDFLGLMETLRSHDCKLSALVAGPFQGADIEKKVRRRLEELPQVHYIGPQYGQSKTDFYESIDVLIFPVRLEYEGIVIHEAMSFGVPVIARDSGCIAEIVNAKVGRLVSMTTDFKEDAWLGISGWLAAPASLQSASRAARKQFTEFRNENIRRLDGLCCQLIGQSIGRNEVEVVDNE